ncbi:MAG: hypothetical protein HY550_10770 [Elusimicrobia bacterium]|nr:hypothetical protein [Elusimicrobiota bacterium]
MLKVEKPRLYLLLAAAVFTSALALYLPSFPGELLWDDEEFIAGNSFVSDCANLGTALNPANLLKVLPVPLSARPVVNASLLADVCSGGGAGGMRLTNVLLHAFNGVLVFFLLLTLCGSAPAALFGALVFALHPASAEVVRIITYRSHLLGFFFFSAGLLSFIFFAREPGLLTGASAVLAYFLAVLSVETPVVLPAAALLAVYFDAGKEGLKRAAPLLLGFLLIAAFYLWFRAPRSGYDLPGSASSGITGPSLLYPAALLPRDFLPPESYATPPPWRELYSNRAANLFTMSAVTLDYFRTLAWPSRLSIDYNPALIRSFGPGVPPLAGCLAALAAGWLLFLKKKLSGLALLFIFLALLPALNILPVYNIRADRYLYLPLAGFALLAAAGFGRASGEGSRRRIFTFAAAGLYLAGLGAVSVRRGPEFRDPLALFSAAVARDPAVPRAQANLAAALLRKGDCGGAVSHSRTAAGLDPGNRQFLLRLAYNLAWCGRGGESALLLKDSPGDPDALFLSGLLRLKTDRARAVPLLKAALEAAPRRRLFFLTLLLAEKRGPAGLAARDREDLAELRKLYRAAGLLL